MFTDIDTEGACDGEDGFSEDSVTAISSWVCVRAMRLYEHQKLTEVACDGESISLTKDPSCIRLSSPRKLALVWVGIEQPQRFSPEPDAKGAKYMAPIASSTPESMGHASFRFLSFFV